MIHIALADDHALIRKGVAEMLSKFSDIKVILEAGTGKELIAKMSNADPMPEVCIVDINMPEMNGYETATELKKRWPKVGILALSMYDTELNIIKMLRSGAHGYLLKDADPEELLQAIVSIHKHGFYYSDIVTGRMLNILHDPDGKTNVDLTDKELQLLKYCCTELTYKEIANEMNLSARTIDGYRETLFRKLNITTRTGLAMYAIKAGMVSIK
ncbi:response regulator transcription factor [Nemorincola caseinilytica]|uniref:Response regulator transcription factor n=1 Tax=Nemorincola caseinilytica TaxID=2054315 RepID=A0ABP8N6Y9_9BACT